MMFSIDNVKEKTGRTEVLSDLNKQIKNTHFEDYDDNLEEFTETELKELVKNKSSYLEEGLNNMPFKLEINSEVKELKKDLQEIQNIVKLSRKDTLETRNRNLDLLMKRYERLVEKKNQLLQNEKEIFKHKKPIEQLTDYRNNLEKKYGKYFFVHMTGQEKEDLLVYYMKAYNVPRDVAQKTIDTSYEHTLEEYKKTKE